MTDTRGMPQRQDASVGVFGAFEDRLMDLLRRLQRARPATRAAVVLAVAAIALAADWLTGPTMSAMLEYALVAAVAAWLFSAPSATAVVVVTLAASMAIDTAVEGARTAWREWINAGLRGTTLLIIMVVVAALRRHIDRAEVASHVDPLTGSWSRRALLHALDREVHGAQRSGSPLSVLYLDLDGLKAVNDTGGHAAGDEIIRALAVVTARHTRRSDMVGRLSGDEFLVICPDTDTAAARRLATRILADPELPSTSIGVAELQHGEHAAQLLARADAAMYAAKRR